MRIKNQPIEFLLAEDNDDDILLIQESFAEAKIVNVLNVVKDGEEAMAYLRREGKYKAAQMPGLVLLDINMPKKNGFEVLKEIKAHPALRSLPVIMLTSSEMEEDIVKSYTQGACSYITKPVQFNNFVNVMKQFTVYWLLIVRLPPPPEI
ncbi:response regulator [Candidatus Poribacteria bacterium]|nr:response regulator [Candidatus Poribacteria bacterium]